MYQAFFSFDFKDFTNAHMVINACRAKRAAEVAFIEKGLWDKTISKGDEPTKKLIEKGVLDSDVTVFLVGERTYGQKWCQYALQSCISNHKSTLGIFLPNQMFNGQSAWLGSKGIKIHEWDSSYISDWINAAARKTAVR